MRFEKNEPPSTSAYSMRISIIINNYNYAAYLDKAVESALAQTHSAREIIVVDDGSTDDSVSIIQGFGGRIKAVLKQNGGQASAFNAGFAVSSGDVIIFLDADDVLHPEALSKLILWWRQGCSRAHWRMPVIDRGGNPTGHFVPSQGEKMAAGDWLPKYLVNGQTASAPTSGNAFAREFLARIMPMPEPSFRICADGYLLRASFFAAPIIAIDEPLSCYRIHGRNHCATIQGHQGRNMAKLRAEIFFSETYRELSIKWARQLGQSLADSYEPMDFGIIKKRLLSFHLERSKHQVVRDTAGKLLYLCLRAAWHDRPRSFMSRVRSCLGCVLLSIIPPDLWRRGVFDETESLNS